MAKPRSRCVQYVVYLAVRLFVCILQAAPLAASLALVRLVAWLAFKFDHRHRRVALENLRLSFPDQYSPRELEQLTHGVYLHFCTVILEIALLPRKMDSRRWRNALLAVAPSDLLRAFATGRPVLIATSHFGNWEMAAYLLGVLGIRAHLVAREMDNPYLDAFMRQFRECIGHTVLSKHGDLRRMHDVLKQGGTICTLGDQDAGARGTFVDFFGRPASTHKVIAFLARKTNALIVVGGAQNMGGVLDYSIPITDVIDPADYAGDADADFAITQRMTHAVEKMVRLDPRQYLWLHQRWKHRPSEAKIALPAAA